MMGSSILFTLVLCPQEGDKSLEELERDSIRLELSIVREVFDPVEVLPVRLRFVNTSMGKRTLKLNPALPMLATVYMEDPDRGAHRAISFRSLDITEPIMTDLDPDDYYETAGFLSPRFTPGKEVPEFRPTREGTWKVWAARELRHVTMKSNTLTITVKENKALPREVRQLFGSEGWHRFALGDGDVNLDPFQKFVQSGMKAPQLDAMAYLLATTYLNQDQKGEAFKMYAKCLSERGENVRLAYPTIRMVEILATQKRFNEALDLLGQVKVNPRDVFRKKVEETKANLLKAKQEHEDRRGK